MKLFLIILVVVVCWLTFYIVFLRAWLKKQPWAEPTFRVMEPVEIWLFDKSETILWSRLLILLGILPPILDNLRLLNIPELMQVMPPDYLPYLSLGFALCGIISEVLRRDTTLPLAIITLPDVVPAPVAAAVEQAVIANQTAVALATAPTMPAAPVVEMNIPVLKADTKAAIAASA